MKKVAVMTWHHYHNFGTALQVTASSRIINELGYDVNVINYIPNGKVVNLNNKPIHKIYLDKIKKKLDNYGIKEVWNEERERNFEDFLCRNIKLTKSVNTSGDLFQLNNEFDAFVCGSDQIWAPSCFNPKYFLDFVEDTDKMIAYAPSIGLTTIEDENIKSLMKYYISRFKYLSIREQQGKDLINNLCHKQAEVVLDPTLLLNSEQWNEVSQSMIYEKPYILCYFLGDNEDTWEHVRKISKQTGLDVKVIPVYEKDNGRGFEVINGVGPAQFLSLISNAEIICTDSFHGTAFSIIYEKPFYVYERFTSKDSNNQNSRIYNILNIIGMENRLIVDKKSVKQDVLVCDYSEARKKLNLKRKESIEYLKKALEGSISKKSEYSYKITNTCCGCGSCKIICPKDAISMERKENGFLEADIDKDKCVKCNLCKKVCPYNENKAIKIDKEKNKLFMIKSKDENVLKKSASGGIGYHISKYLSTNDFDVTGCIYNKDIQEAEHKVVKAGNIEALNLLQGSKYIQSNIFKAFEENLINGNKSVIFGTPCQIAGVDKVLKLKNRREDFVLVDLICHGVPSQNLWKKYLKEGSQKHGYEIDSMVEFRDKTKDWRSKNIKIIGKNKKYTGNDKEDLFYRFFEIGHCFSEVCFECNYRVKSSADIRIGDYWGPRYKKDKTGVSMVISMTDKGEDILNKLSKSGQIIMEQMECSEYWTVQYPTNPIKPVFYEELILDLTNEKLLLENIAVKYCKNFEANKKISESIMPLRKIYRSMRKKNECRK